MSLNLLLTKRRILAAIFICIFGGAPVFAAPLSDSDPRASLRHSSLNTFQLDRCKLAMQRCLVQPQPSQGGCFSAMATQGFCADHFASKIMNRRQAIEQRASSDVGVSKCLESLDSAIGAWLTSNPDRIDSVDFTSDQESLTRSLSQCEALARLGSTK